MNVRIASTGAWAPPRVEAAADVAERLGRTPEWITSRTGVLRRHVSDDETLPELAAHAARIALGDGPPPDLIVFAAASAHQALPDTAPFVLRELGLDGIRAFSVNAACLSFLAGFDTASALIHAGLYQRVLVVSAELATPLRDWDEPESAALLGDGAGAAVLEPSGDTGSRVVAHAGGTWPEGAELSQVRGGGFRALRQPEPGDDRFHMRGPAMWRFTRERFGPILDSLLARAGWAPGEVDRIIPHQPSARALVALQAYGFPADKIEDSLTEFGNCVAASMPMALDQAARAGRLRRGDRVLLLGTAAGLSIGGTALIY